MRTASASGTSAPLASSARASLFGRDGFYLAGRYGVGILVGLGNMLVLTWWIGPHAYGVFLTAMGLAALLASLSRVGVDTYLVRRETPPHENEYACAAAVIATASAFLIGCGIAVLPLLVRWFHNREFVGPFLALLLTIPVAGMAGIPTAKLERELRFRSLASLELLGQVSGLVISFALAWGGKGVWAPVTGQLTWQMFVLIVALQRSRVSLRLRMDLTEISCMLRYGSP